MKFYLIGIKGSGMSSLANVLLDDGYEIRGLDKEIYIHTEEKLLKRNVIIDDIKSKEYLNSDIIIIGHNFYNKELIDELNLKEKIFFEYHEFLSLYLNSKKLVSICGSHGKTTLVKMLSNSNDYFSFLNGEGEGRKIKNELFFILESCEYKNHFLIYHPNQIIITNIDYDHVDFFKSKEDYINSFKLFIKNCKKVYCKKEEYELLEKKDNLITCGLEPCCSYYLYHEPFNQDLIDIKIFHNGNLLDEFRVKNNTDEFLEKICFVYAFYNENNLSIDSLNKKLNDFKNPYQRFNEVYNLNHIIVKDYAHHPSQVIYNFKQCDLFYKNYIKVAIFKLDRVSRLIKFKYEYQKALSKFDLAFVLPLSNVEDNQKHSSKELINEKIRYIDNIDKISNYLNFNKKYIFSFMSSKDLSNEVNKLINIINKQK